MGEANSYCVGRCPSCFIGDLSGSLAVSETTGDEGGWGGDSADPDNQKEPEKPVGRAGGKAGVGNGQEKAMKSDISSEKVTDIDEIRRKVEERRQAEVVGADLGPDMKGGSGGGVTSSFIRKALFANELGDGMIFAEHFSDQYLFCKNSQQWFRWTGHYWERDVLDIAISGVETVAELYLNEAKKIVADIDAAIKNKKKEEVFRLEDLQSKVYKRVLRLRSDRGRGNTLKFAHTNPENALAISGNEFDKDPWLLGCLNGTVDLRTGLLIPGRRDDFITKVAPVEWAGLDAVSPAWERFLSEILLDDQDTIDFLSRLFGYAITGLRIEAILPVLCGKGRNGKGTIVETLLAVLGPLAAPIPSEMLIDQGRVKSSSGPSPDIMSLRGLRIAFASETDENRRFSQSKVKWLTGNDSLTGRNPHDREPTTFSPSHTLFLMTNNIPNASADDFGFWERTKIVPFTLSFVTREPAATNERPADIHLPDKLKAEAPGILAWLVRGCLCWQRHGFKPSEAVLAATRRERAFGDWLQDFIDEWCYLDPKAEVIAGKLYEKFLEWAEKNMGKKSTPSPRRFGLAMVKRFERRKKGVHIYQGLGLLDAPIGSLG